MSKDEMKIMEREENKPDRNKRPVRVVSPPCDVYEDGKEFLIVAEMPGVDEKDIQLRFDRTRLTIEAERHSTLATDAQGQPAALRYARAFEVPDTIDGAEIAASLDNGILSVRLPKAPQARVRQIRVTSG